MIEATLPRALIFLKEDLESARKDFFEQFRTPHDLE
jgi:hypothetical protein